MPFLNLDLDYFDHPKTRKLVGILGEGADMLPLKLWVYAAKFHPKDGKLDGYTWQAIEKILQWKNDSGQAIDALENVGFIETTKKGFKIHDWTAHQGHIYALKMRNKKVAKNRWNNIKKSQSTVNTNGIPKNTTSIPRSVPFQSLPFQSLKDNEKALTLEANDASRLSKNGNNNGNNNGYDKDLVDEVCRSFDDEKSRGFYIQQARRLGDGLLREFFADVKSKIREGVDIGNPGAYLGEMLRREKA